MLSTQNVTFLGASLQKVDEDRVALSHYALFYGKGRRGPRGKLTGRDTEALAVTPSGRTWSRHHKGFGFEAQSGQHHGCRFHPWLVEVSRENN